MDTSFHKSPLHYPGAKSRAIKFLKEYFPQNFKEYRELFFGGGSIGIYLTQIHFRQKELQFFASDLNYDVYCFWQMLKTQNEKLINEIQHIKDKFKNGKELYRALIERRNSKMSDFQRAVDFFILNRITFSGVVDCGGYSQKAFESRFTQSSIERLWKIYTSIQNFHFSASDYTELLEKDGDDVFIFLDPPYFGASKSKLYGKKGDLHIHFNHERLCKKLKNTKHKFLLTYDDSEFIKKLYKDFYIQEWNLQYGMNNFKQEKAAKGAELLISNFSLEKNE